MSLKLKYNITTWPKLGLNYWAIPKCGSSSIKFSLLEKSNLVHKDDIKDDDNWWVHWFGIDIDPDTAIGNGNKNFTVVRNPIDRVKSFYQNFNDIKQLPDLDQFLNDYVKNSTDDEFKDRHLRSLSYFLDKFPSNGYLVDIKNIEFIKKKFELDIPKLNETNNIIQLNDDHKQIIRNRYPKDFETWYS